MNTIQHLRLASLRSAAAAFLILTTGTVALNAQEGTEGHKRAMPQEPAMGEKMAADYTTTSRMLSAPVFLQASAEKVAEAQREGEEADRPKAKITEWLIDSRNGQLSQAVVSIGGFLGIGDKTVLVPASDLRWNNSMERYDLGWTKDQLKAKPAFDLDAACKTGLDACCGFMADSGMKSGDMKKNDEKKDTEASMAKGSKVANTEFMRTSNCLVKASEIAALPVYAGANEWGKAKDLIVDRKQNRIVLAVVRHGATLGMGGKDYLIAYPHLVSCQKSDESKLLCAPTSTATQLEASVPFEEPKNGVVDPAAAQRALANVTMDTKHEAKN